MGVTRQLDISADFTGAMSGNIVARQLAGQASGRECYGGVSAPGNDALETLLIRHPLNLEQVREVRVRLAPSLQRPINNSQSPDLCLQHLVAVMLIDKTVSFQAAHDGGRMQDPTILKLRSKVILISDEEFEQRLLARTRRSR